MEREGRSGGEWKARKGTRGIVGPAPLFQLNVPFHFYSTCRIITWPFTSSIFSAFLSPSPPSLLLLHLYCFFFFTTSPLLLHSPKSRTVRKLQDCTQRKTVKKMQTFVFSHQHSYVFLLSLFLFQLATPKKNHLRYKRDDALWKSRSWLHTYVFFYIFLPINTTTFVCILS